MDSVRVLLGHGISAGHGMTLGWNMVPSQPPGGRLHMRNHSPALLHRSLPRSNHALSPFSLSSNIAVLYSTLCNLLFLESLSYSLISSSGSGFLNCSWKHHFPRICPLT
jgi:hypothetical protein